MGNRRLIKEKASDSKIIMVTAYDNSENKTTAIERGADSFIGKPFSRETIYHAISEFVY